MVTSSVTLRQGTVISITRDGDHVTEVAVSGRGISPAALRSIRWETVFALDHGDLTPLFLVRVPVKTWTPEWCTAVAEVVRAAVMHDMPVMESVAERLGTTPAYVNRICGRLRREGYLTTISEERRTHSRHHEIPLEKVAADFRTLRDRGTEVSVRRTLAKRWGTTPARTANLLRRALDEGYLIEGDKMAPGRPRATRQP